MKRKIKFKPSPYICPEKYCFFWDETNQKCDECFKNFNEKHDCTRKNLLGNHDYYEPYEPELWKDRLPKLYFMRFGKKIRKVKG